MKFLCCLALCLAALPAHAAVVIVDSFSEENFQLAADRTTGTASSISSPYGQERVAVISGRLVPAGGTLTSTLDSGAGDLSFAAHGQSVSSRPLSLTLSYVTGGPYGLDGMSAFEFDFSSLTGAGSVVVELGGAGVYDSSTLRLAVDQAGMVSVPFSLINFSSGATTDSFRTLSFTFEARSEDFSFTLDEIRAVPEASTLMASALGAGALALRRRRR